MKTHHFFAGWPFFLILILFPFLSVIPGPSIAQSAREICELAANKVQLGNSEMVSTLVIMDAKGRKRIRKIATASQSYGNLDKRILQFVEPADVAGTSILIYDHEFKDDDMWIYLPALRKVRRIISTEKSKNFMGSEFTNADLSKPDPDDYFYEKLGNELVNDKMQEKIRVSCHDEKIKAKMGFSFKIMWIDSKTRLTTKINYYSTNDGPDREQYFRDYRVLPEGKFIAGTMSMYNLKNKRTSVMTIDEIQTGSALSELLFSPTKLQDL